MTDNSRKFRNKSLDDFFQEIKDISYIVDGNSRINLSNEYHYTDLVLLYEQNKGQEMTKYCLFDKHVDSEGKSFIRLTAKGSECVKNYNMFFEHKKHDFKISKKDFIKYVENKNDELISDVDKSIRKSNNNLKFLGTLKKNSLENVASVQLIMIKSNPSFYKCEDFNQFDLYNN
ncbi:MAG TPA: hypothetical protein V6C58_11440 [Allocoleopsis sp.]